jgi:hypothetical protein
MTIVTQAREYLEVIEELGSDHKIDSLRQTGVEMRLWANMLHDERSKKDRDVMLEKRIANLLNGLMAYQCQLIGSLQRTDPVRMGRLNVLMKPFPTKAKSEWQIADVTLVSSGRIATLADVATADQWAASVMDDINAMTSGMHSDLLDAMQSVYRQLSACSEQANAIPSADSFVCAVRFDSPASIDNARLSIEYAVVCLNKWFEERYPSKMPKA